MIISLHFHSNVKIFIDTLSVYFLKKVFALSCAIFLLFSLRFCLSNLTIFNCYHKCDQVHQGLKDAFPATQLLVKTPKAERCLSVVILSFIYTVCCAGCLVTVHYSILHTAIGQMQMAQISCRKIKSMMLMLLILLTVQNYMTQFRLTLTIQIRVKQTHQFTMKESTYPAIDKHADST